MIRIGDIDATVCQTADVYAKYALHHAPTAAEGKISPPGPTGHDSTIILLPNCLEVRLPFPPVTEDNVDDPPLRANHATDVQETPPPDQACDHPAAAGLNTLHGTPLQKGASTCEMHP